MTTGRETDLSGVAAEIVSPQRVKAASEVLQGMKEDYFIAGSRIDTDTIEELNDAANRPLFDVPEEMLAKAVANSGPQNAQDVIELASALATQAKPASVKDKTGALCNALSSTSISPTKNGLGDVMVTGMRLEAQAEIVQLAYSFGAEPVMIGKVVEYLKTQGTLRLTAEELTALKAYRKGQDNEATGYANRYLRDAGPAQIGTKLTGYVYPSFQKAETQDGLAVEAVAPAVYAVAVTAERARRHGELTTALLQSEIAVKKAIETQQAAEKEQEKQAPPAVAQKPAGGDKPAEGKKGFFAKLRGK